jgi:tetratricopeptide (TPR) repeat protein
VVRTSFCVWLVLVAAGCDRAPTPNEGVTPSPDAKALLAASAELEKAGDFEGALKQAESAFAADAGRDSAITVAKLAIVLERYDRAQAVLEPVVAADANDAIAHYDLGLVHHRRDDYNRARKSYLAALRADPKHAEARLNLAMLCWKQGVQEEARHHVERFRASFPGDPRGDQLQAMLTTAPTPTPAAAAGPG